MRACCTCWHICAAGLGLLLLAPVAFAQEAEPPAPPPPTEAPAEEAAATEVVEAPPEDPAAAEALSPPAVPPPPATEGEPAALDDEAPPGSARAATRRPENALDRAAAPPPRYWRLPREGTRRPLTLPQGVMYVRSIVSVAVIPFGSTTSGRGSGYVGYAVGIFDDLEIGTYPVGVIFAPPFEVVDPSFFLRARLVSGEVQFALRGEWTIPAGNNRSPWMGYSAELAWTPVEWFRFETAVEYGLHFQSPLQQTIHVPLRALFQAGPNTFGVTTGAVMYNDADDFDVPLHLRWAVSFGGWQGPLSEPAIEGGFADLTTADRAWFIRGVWTFYAYP